MPSSPRDIRLLVSDVDGVWTDGRIIYSDTRETKEFNVRDGLGVKLAQRAGILIAVITSRRSKALERRCRELGIGELVQGSSDKLATMIDIAGRLDVSMPEICYIGDDLPDLAPMSAAGLSAAPSDAAPEVLAAAGWKLETAGGRGALRELIERLLKERGEWARIVESFHAGNFQTPRV